MKVGEQAGTFQHKNAKFQNHLQESASNTPTVVTKLMHGRNIQAYPVKTTYKVGEGFDSTGFKLVYKDENNGHVF